MTTRAEIDAYLETTYEVWTDPTIRFRVNTVSPALDLLLDRHAVRTAIYVTAQNPRGRVRSTSFNSSLQRALIREVQD